MEAMGSPAVGGGFPRASMCGSVALFFDSLRFMQDQLTFNIGDADWLMPLLLRGQLVCSNYGFNFGYCLCA
jgi:hypothetical protein